MNNIKSISDIGINDLLKQKSKIEETGGEAFIKHLKSALDDVNKMQLKKEVAVADIATGQVKDLHQAAMAINKAEMSMKLMLEIRNKALNAYKEIGRTQL